MKAPITLIITSLALAGVGCSSRGPVAESTAMCTFPRSDKIAPEWVCDKPVKDLALYAIGTAEWSDAGVSFMRKDALAQARSELAQKLRTNVDDMFKFYTETTGVADSRTIDSVKTSLSRQVSRVSLEGTQIHHSVFAPDGTLYMLIGLDDNSARLAAKQIIRSSYNNDRALWQKLQAKKSFEELSEEITKLYGENGGLSHAK